MNKFQSISAILLGAKLCFFNADIRKLAIWPWIIGFVVYIFVAIGAVYSHEFFLARMISEPEGFFSHALYYLAWLGLALFLVVASLIITLVLVLVLTCVFQTSIAEKVLKLEGISVVEVGPGISGIAKEAARSISTESVKLLWLLPILALVFILGFIPIFLPVAVIIAAWLLAYESLDIVLDVMQIKAMKRLKFAMSHGLSVILFGLTLTALALIPFVGFLLPPVAVAGAAWLLGQHSELIDTLKDT